MKIYLLFILFILNNSFSFGGCYLVLKKGHKKICTLWNKTEIVYFTCERWNNGIIDSIGDGFIIIKGEKIFLYDIQYLKLVSKSLNYQSSGLMLVLGGVYFTTVDILNRMINKENLGISENTAFISGLFISTGLILYLLSAKSYKLEGKFMLCTICL